MDYSDQQIKDISYYAGNLTPITDIAALMGLNARLLRMDIADEDNPVSAAYHRAKAQTALRIRQNELQLADAGSPLAVQLMAGYVRDMDAEEDL